MTVTLVKVTLKLPVLVTVIVCCALVVPSTCGPKTKLVGVTVKTLVSVTPVPLRLTTVAVVEALSVMVTVAVYAAAAAGVKVTPTVQVLPVGPCDSVPEQLLLMAKSAGLLPPNTMELMVTGEAPVFVSRMLGLRGLCVVATWGGNVMVKGETVRPSDPVMPVPESVITAVVAVPPVGVYEIVTVAVRTPDAVGVK